MINRRNFLALLSAVPPVCKAALANAAEWHHFARELSRTLSNLKKHQFLILEAQPPHYVQFVCEGSRGMRAESVSNGYLQGANRLSDEARSKVLKLGWNAPTIIPDPVSDRRGYDRHHGSPNYFLDFDPPVPHRFLANLAASTLHGVFGAQHPRELRYTAFEKRGGNIDFANLRR
jgi:hypothetical protein